MSNIVHLNGRLLPIEQATVSVLDRGFVFGDGVYEVIPVYARRPFRLTAHLARLAHSLDAIRLDNPHDEAEWTALIEALIAQNTLRDQAVYLQVTRGAAPRDHAFPAGVAPTVFMMSTPLDAPTPRQVAEGVRAIGVPDPRWARCDIKTISLLPNVLLRQMAVDAGVDEAILFRDGILTEGAASNIFAVERGTLLAPPKDHHMLPGITYDLVLELAAALAIPVRIGRLEEARVRAADELWLASSPREVLAIVTLDGKPVADGRPGPLFRRMHQRYQQYKQTEMGHG